MKKQYGKIIGKGIAGAVGILLILLLSYFIYLLVDYHRIDDNVALEIHNPTESEAQKVITGQDYTIITYNIGFAAYTPEFSFFMDGGTESRAFSKEAVETTMEGIIALLQVEDADFLMLEEVDEDSTRSHHVDQCAMLTEALETYSSIYAVNYDSSFLFYPFFKPIGKSRSGMLTLSRYTIEEATRYRLPVEESLMKFLDLDRCYSVVRIPVDNGRELLLYTVHLSAYTSDGSIAEEQLDILLKDMGAEYEKGNYIVCGGDFNKDLLEDSSVYFGVSTEGYTWAQAFPKERLAEYKLTLCVPLDEENPVPSCRNADAPYHEGQLVLTVDGFIVSDNVTVTQCIVTDGNFTYSDHNPVKMTFQLKD